jgi:hypothetical protein
VPKQPKHEELWVVTGPVPCTSAKLDADGGCGGHGGDGLGGGGLGGGLGRGATHITDTCVADSDVKFVE